MTTLGDFGGGVDEGAVEVEFQERSTPGARCEAIVVDGEMGRRCQNTAGSRRSLCQTHEGMNHVLTVESPPEDLLGRIGRRAGRCRGRKSDGDRCIYKTSATTLVCSMHSDQSREEYVDRETGELDQERIAAAVDAVQSATDGGDADTGGEA